MRPPAAFFLLPVAAALATFAIPPVRAAEPAPSPSPSPAAAVTPAPDPATERIETLAKALVAAPDDDSRRRLLAEAPPELAGDERVRRRFYYLTGALIYAGEYDRARALHAFMRAWCEPLGDRVGLMLSEWAEGNIEGYRGHNAAALARFETARRFFAETGDTKREASLWTCASIVHLRLGDYRRALAGTERALAIHRAANDGELIATDLQLIGNIFNEQGQPERAFGFWEQALAAAGNDEEWQLMVSHNMGEGRANLGDTPGAIVYLERALALARKRGDRSRVAESLTTLGYLHAGAGRPEAAEPLFREALAMGEELKETHRQAVALVGLGGVVARRGDAAEALKIAERATALARETGEPGDRWPALTLLGRLQRLAGQPAEARTALEGAIAAIEDTRGRLTGGDAEATAFFEDKTAPYHEMVALLVGENRPDEALAFAEQAKARVLVEALSGPKTSVGQALTPAELGELTARGEAVAALNKELAAAPADRRGDVETRLAAARVARDAAEADALQAHPELRLRRQPAAGPGGPARLAVMTLLAPAQPGRSMALLEFAVGPEETFAFVARSGPAVSGPNWPQVQTFRLPLGRAALASRTEHYRRTLADRGLNWAREARALGEDLLGPVRAALAGVEKLVVVPDGPLWELPFQTLPMDKGEGPLRARDTLAARRLSVAPSLRFLLLTLEGPGPKVTPPREARLLAFGNPTLKRPVKVSPKLLATAAPAPANLGTLRDDELAPLPDAENEVRALAKLYGPERCRVFVGDEAREATFRREAAGNYDVIHFATHGVCNDRAPLYSHLLLSQSDLAPDEDGLLEAWELMRQPLHARLAVLSACETGRGRVGAGEGMIGLSWALFTAGCPACVVSQWKVDSASNTDLMVGFHRELRAGAGRAEALRRASLALAERPEYRHPFYWAPFVLVGDGD